MLTSHVLAEESIRRLRSKRDVEPTNNLAERTLRHAVVWRKMSYGSRSEPGLRWMERGLSVRQTLRIKASESEFVLVSGIYRAELERMHQKSWII